MYYGVRRKLSGPRSTMRAQLSRPPRYEEAEITPAMKALRLALDAMNAWREEQEKQEDEERRDYEDRFEGYFAGPSVCRTCNESVAEDWLGGQECAACFYEH